MILRREGKSIVLCSSPTLDFQRGPDAHPMRFSTEELALEPPAACDVPLQKATLCANLAKRPKFVLNLVVGYLVCLRVEPKLVIVLALLLVLEAPIGRVHISH